MIKSQPANDKYRKGHDQIDWSKKGAKDPAKSSEPEKK